MKVFQTIYPQNGANLRCYVHAKDRKSAETILIFRGLKEKIVKAVPYRRRLSAYDLYQGGEFVPLLHYLTFVGGLAVRAGLISIESLCIEEIGSGLIHPLVHEMQYGKKYRDHYASIRYRYIVRLKKFDRKVKRLGF